LRRITIRGILLEKHYLAAHMNTNESMEGIVHTLNKLCLNDKSKKHWTCPCGLWPVFGQWFPEAVIG
jgi:hypothetical protein